MENNKQPDEETKRRIEKIGQYAAQALLTCIVAQCYSFYTGRLSASEKPIGSGEFCQLLNSVLMMNDPITYIVYDDDSSSFWYASIPKFEGLDITRTDHNPIPNGLGFPEYDIRLRFRILNKYGGTAEELYNAIDQKAMELLQKGWDELRDNPGIKPVGMITPHDLCAYVNFYETLDRIIWFILYILSTSQQQTGLLVPGYIVSDRWTIMSLELFISLAAAGISKNILQPTDMLPRKAYLIRAMADFRQQKLEGNSVPPFLSAYLKGQGFNFKECRLIPLDEAPRIRLALFTSVIQELHL